MHPIFQLAMVKPNLHVLARATEISINPSSCFHEGKFQHTCKYYYYVATNLCLNKCMVSKNATTL